MTERRIQLAIDKYNEDGDPNKLHTLLDYIDKYTPSRCASCGEARNLTSGIAAGNEILYCRRCKADEEQR